jgi:cephalosporin hydroxylase
MPVEIPSEKQVTSLRRLWSRAIRPLRQRAAGQIGKSFHQVWYDSGVWQSSVHWQGARILKNPFDMWIYQELIHRTRPDLIIETGTFSGGSALFFAHMLDLNGHGRVVTVDVSPNDVLPEHPRITYITGSSTDSQVVDRLTGLARKAGQVMVVLDSDHSRQHVAEELRLLSGLVSPGCYLVVEDTNINGHPAFPGFGPGPMEAVQAFLPVHPEFLSDESCERFLMTWNPSGWLRRISVDYQ